MNLKVLTYTSKTSIITYSKVYNFGTSIMNSETDLKAIYITYIKSYIIPMTKYSRLWKDNCIWRCEKSVKWDNTASYGKLYKYG